MSGLTAEGNSPLTEALFEQDRLLSLLGAKLIPGVPGRVQLRYEVQENVLQGHGVCHGDVIFSLADAACGIAANAEDSSAVTHHGSIALLHPASSGEVLIVTAMEKSRSGRNITLDAEVMTESGTLVAELRGMAREMRPRRD